MTKVLVNSQGKPYIVESNKVLLGNTFGTKTITENGTYTASSDNLDGYSSVTVNVSGGGSKYSLFDRIKDDSNNEIGTVCGFFTDSNDVEYAVVCLDAQYRLANGAYCSKTSTAITNLPQYADQSVYSATETATFNTQKILDFCTAQSATSTACSHCRSKSFVIGEVTYQGQLPNLVELIDILRRRVGINLADTSASSYSSLVISATTKIWCSSQNSSNSGWNIYSFGAVYTESKTVNCFVAPVLEIPNN